MAVSISKQDQLTKDQNKVGPIQDQAALVTPPEDLLSGDISIDLGLFSSSAAVSKAEAAVSGKPFFGRLSNLRGTTVALSAIVYPAVDGDGSPAAGEKAFIVDFGTMITVYSLELMSHSHVITLVLPWVGTAFGTQSLFPGTAGSLTYIGTPVQADKSGLKKVAFSGVDSMKLLIQVRTSKTAFPPAAFAQICRIQTGTFPANIQASIGERPPFWTFPGNLTEAVSITGLAAEMNVALKKLSAPQGLSLKLKTNTAGVLQGDFEAGKDIVVQQKAAAVWGGSPSVELAVDAQASHTVDFYFQLPPEVNIKADRLEMKAAANLPAWRTMEGSGTPLNVGLKVTTDISAAQPLSVTDAITLHGFSLPFYLPQQEAEARLELFAEIEGKAGGKPKAFVELKLAENKKSGIAWQDVLFQTPLALDDGQTYWLVLTGKRGVIQWAGALRADGAAAMHNAGGGRWLDYPAVQQGMMVQAEFRPLRQPLDWENEAPMTIGRPDEVPVELVFDKDGISKDVVLALKALSLKAAADGLLTLQAVLKSSIKTKLAITEATLYYSEDAVT